MNAKTKSRSHLYTIAAYVRYTVSKYWNNSYQELAFDECIAENLIPPTTREDALLLLQQGAHKQFDHVLMYAGSGNRLTPVNLTNIHYELVRCVMGNYVRV